MLNKDLVKDCEVIVEYSDGQGDKADLKPISFTINPGSLLNIKDVSVKLSSLISETITFSQYIK